MECCEKTDKCKHKISRAVYHRDSKRRTFKQKGPSSFMQQWGGNIVVAPRGHASSFLYGSGICFAMLFFRLVLFTRSFALPLLFSERKKNSRDSTEVCVTRFYVNVALLQRKISRVCEDTYFLTGEMDEYDSSRNEGE